MLKKYKDLMPPLNEQRLKRIKGGHENSLTPIACEGDFDCFNVCGTVPGPRGFRCINHTCRSVLC